MNRVTRIRSTVWATAVLVPAIILAGCGGAKETKAPAATTPAATTPAATTPAATTPAASAPAPAVSANVPLVVVDSLVIGSANLTDADKAAGKSCVLTSRYLHNQQVVWRVKVVDPVTGKSMDGASLSMVQVQLGDGQKFDAKYAPHPKNTPTDSFWATSWTIPESYPSGTVPYKIVAESKDGRKGEFLTFIVAPSALIVADGSIPKVVK